MPFQAQNLAISRNSSESTQKNMAVRKVDEILDFAVEFRITGLYPEGLNANKRRAVRKRAKVLIVDQGEVFFKRSTRYVATYNIIYIYVCI